VVPLPAVHADSVRACESVMLEGPEDWETHYPEGARTLRRFQSLAAVPFVFHGEALGAMGISFAQPHHFTTADRTFLMALARQCGQALERARLYEERSYVARTLQEGLLPDRLADVPGLDVAVRYLSISDGGSVGGDFYDLFDVTPSRWMLAVGDVCGKGTAAAVLTGLARHTIRAIAMREEAPEDVLAFLNEAMRRQLGDSSYCTVGCATLAPRGDGGFIARLASGGHVYPLLLRPGEPVREIEVRGTLLGFVPDLRLDAVTLELEPGDALVYYTDGIIDARHEEDRFGEDRLIAALERARDATADEIADTVDEAVRRHQPEAPRDDRAILVVRVTG
jgi:serine phosphatase RsbU (regulator of sigma subunit)